MIQLHPNFLFLKCPIILYFINQQLILKKAFLIALAPPPLSLNQEAAKLNSFFNCYNATMIQPVFMLIINYIIHWI